MAIGKYLDNWAFLGKRKPSSSNKYQIKRHKNYQTIAVYAFNVYLLNDCVLVLNEVVGIYKGTIGEKNKLKNTDI